MNKAITFFASILLLATAFTANAYCQSHSSMSSLSADQQSKISSDLGLDMPAYQIRNSSQGSLAENSGQNLKIKFGADGVEVNRDNAALNLKFLGVRDGSAITKPRLASFQARGNRFEYQRGAVTEWYVNGPVGLEQGFTVSRPLTKAATLTIAFDMAGSLTPVAQDKNTVVLEDEGKREILRYSGLSARDARGRELEASLSLRDHTVFVAVNTVNAQYPIVIDPWLQSAELTSSNEQQLDYLGISVAVSGNTVVVGAQNASVHGNSQQGAAYVYVRPTGGWSNMTQTAKLTSSDGAANDRFGSAVAINGNTIVVGSSVHNDGVGAAYVFVEPANGWANMTETAELAGATKDDGSDFGASVAISGNTIVVGAFGEKVGGAGYIGAAFVYVEPEGGWQAMNPTAELSASDGTSSAAFGWSVAISGTTVAIGAPDQTFGHKLQGAVYVYVRGVEGWQTTSHFNAELTESDAEQGDQLGTSVSMSSSSQTIVGGNPAAVINGNEYQGAAYVFVRPNGGWQSMTQTAKLTSSDGGTGDYLGNAVATEDNMVMAAAPNRNSGSGTVYFYLASVAGWSDMTQTAEINASDEHNYDRFGTSISMDGSTMVSGAPQHTVGGATNGGAAYVFTNGTLGGGGM